MEYQDVLWHFSSGESVSKLQEKHFFLLRVLDSEEELFETDRQRESTGTDVGLPVFLPDKEQLNTTKYSAKQSVMRGQQMASVQAWEAYVGGLMLWSALPTAVTDQLLQALSNSDSRPLRLKISGSSPGVTDPPWEWLCDGIRPPFALHSNVLLVRSVPIRHPLPPLTTVLPVRVLLVLTNPTDEQLLDSFREINAVQYRLRLPDYELRILAEPTLDALQEELVTAPPAIVHYIGHAGLSYGEGNLILHDNRGQSFWLSATQLARMLPSSVRLLCLSTCFTTINYQLLGLPRLAHAPASLSLPTVVANQFPVQEDTVRVFWYTFYDALASGRDVSDAVHAARIWTRQINPVSADWSSFTLVLRDGAGQPFLLHQRTETISPKRTDIELQAQFATQLVNELAEQLRELSASEGKTPHELRKQLEREQARTLDLHAKLKNLT